MSGEITDLLAVKFKLAGDEQRILTKPVRDLTRAERRLYFSAVKLKEKDFKSYLTGRYGLLDRAGREDWLNFTLESMLAKRGEPDLTDRLMMDIIGKFEVYQKMRARAEEKGVVLRALTNFGGVGLALYFFVAIALIIIFIKFYLFR